MSDAVTARRAGLAACAAGAVLVLAACSSSTGIDYSEPVGSSPATAESSESLPSSAAPGSPSRSEDSSGDASETEPTSPSPSAEASDSAGSSASATPSSPSGTPSPEAMDASEPAALAIPGLDVTSEVMELGLQENGVIEVPPYGGGSPAGWFTRSPTPGEQGPSVILGHRNAYEGGPGIFAELPSMEVGDSVEVTRDDGSTAQFTVYRTEQFSQENFPTLEVYGNTEGPELRLITCDGLNEETGALEDNFIVYAKLQS